MKKQLLTIVLLTCLSSVFSQSCETVSICYESKKDTACHIFVPDWLCCYEYKEIECKNTKRAKRLQRKLTKKTGYEVVRKYDIIMLLPGDFILTKKGRIKYFRKIELKQL